MLQMHSRVKQRLGADRSPHSPQPSEPLSVTPGAESASRFAPLLSSALVQVYNEQVFDMLRDPSRGRPLEVHEDPREGIYVQGLSE